MSELEELVYTAKNWLNGIEDGSLHLSDAFHQASEMDATLVFLMTRYLREKHKTNDTVSARVLARLVELSSMYPAFVKQCKSGEKDAIAEWFTDSYKFSEYFKNPEEFIRLIVEKLDS